LPDRRNYQRRMPRQLWLQKQVRVTRWGALLVPKIFHRDQAIDALWLELDPEAGAANLHNAAHYGRKAAPPSSNEVGPRKTIG
jgi:DNA-binding SARP family transcriptional activator